MPDTLPIHPRTGLRAVGIVGGRPVWPILGGSAPLGGTGPATPAAGDAPPAPPTGAPGIPPSTPPAAPHAPAPHPATGSTPPAGPPATGAPGPDAPLGEAGLRALQAERDRANAAERELTSLRGNATEVQQARAAQQQAEQQLAAERTERLRLQIAHQHGVPADALVLLTGTTQEQLTAQASQIAALRGAQQPPVPAPPAFAPNPGQAAGNAGSAAPAASVAAGRDLYRQNHTSKT